MVPPLVVIGGVLALSYALHRSWKGVVGLGLSMLLILNLGYWQETLETVALVVFATSISLLVGVPVGILAARKNWLYVCLRPVLDLMQTIPTFVYLIPTLMLFGLGVVQVPTRTGFTRRPRTLSRSMMFLFQ